MERNVLTRLNYLMKLWGKDYPIQLNNMTLRQILNSSDNKLRFLKSSIQEFLSNINPKDRNIFLDLSVTANIQSLMNAMQTGNPVKKVNDEIKKTAQASSSILADGQVRSSGRRRRSVERRMPAIVYDNAVKESLDRIVNVPETDSFGVDFSRREYKQKGKDSHVWKSVQNNFSNLTDDDRKKVQIIERKVPFINVKYEHDGKQAQIRGAYRQFEIFLDPSILDMNQQETQNSNYNYLLSAAINDIAKKLNGQRGVMIASLAYRDGTYAPVSEETIESAQQGIVTRDKVEMCIQDLFDRLHRDYDGQEIWTFDPETMFISVVLLSEDSQGESYSVYIKSLVESTKIFKNPNIYIPKNEDNKCLIYCLYYYFINVMVNDIEFEEFEKTIHGDSDFEKIKNFCVDNQTQCIALSMDKDNLENIHPVIIGQFETDIIRDYNDYCYNFVIDQTEACEYANCEFVIDKYKELKRTLFLCLIETKQGNHWICGNSKIISQDHVIRYNKRNKLYEITNGKFNAEKCKICNQWKREAVHLCLCKVCGRYINEDNSAEHMKRCRVEIKQKTVKSSLYGRKTKGIDEDEDMIEPYYQISTCSFEIGRKTIEIDDKIIVEPNSILLRGEFFNSPKYFIESDDKYDLVKTFIFLLNNFKKSYSQELKKSKYRVRNFYFFCLDARKYQNYILQRIIYEIINVKEIKIDKYTTFSNIEYNGEKIHFGIKFLGEGQMINRLTLTFGNIHFNFCDLSLYCQLSYEDIQKNFNYKLGKQDVNIDYEQMLTNCEINRLVAMNIGKTYTNISKSKIVLFNKMTFAGASQNMFFDFIQDSRSLSFTHNNHYRNNELAECEHLTRLLREKDPKVVVCSCKYEGCNNRMCDDYNKSGYDDKRKFSNSKFIPLCKAKKMIENYSDFMNDCRSSIIGGRTEIFRHYVNVRNNSDLIVTLDQNSSYPYVMSKYDFPVGRETIEFVDNIDEPGIYCVDISPPNKLDFPVLPFIANNKIMFGLCQTCCEECEDVCTHTDEERMIKKQEYTHIELNKAIQKGYTVKKVYYVRKYDRWVNSPMKQYNRVLYLMKQISRCKTDEEFAELCDLNEDIVRDGLEEICLDCYEKKQIYEYMMKSLLNNQWGKLAMENKEMITRMFSCAEYVQLCCDGKLVVKKLNKFNIFDDKHILVNYNQMTRENHVGTHFGFASYVLSYGRLELLNMIEKIGPKNMIACSTDSVTFVKDSLFDFNKYNIGKEMGQWKFEGKECDRYAAIIPNFSIKMHGYDVVQIKTSGVTLKMDNEDICNMPTFMKYIERLKKNSDEDNDDGTIYNIRINEQIMTRKKYGSGVEIKSVDKQLKLSTLKRIILENDRTRPFGTK